MSHSFFTPDDMGYGPEFRAICRTNSRRRWPSIVPLLLPLVLLVSGSRCAEPQVNCHPRAQEYIDFHVEQHWQLFADGRGAC